MVYMWRGRANILKLQSAMEYLMTYGWAIIVIAVVLAALYQLGFFSGTNFITTSCIAESGFTCQKPVMNVTGYVEVNIGQISNGTMTITGVACTNSTASPSSFTTPSTTVFQSGQTAQVVTQCPGIGSSGKIGTSFRGYIWVQYSFAGQSGLVAEIAVLSAIATTPTAFLAPPPPDIYCVGGRSGSAVAAAYYAPLSSNGMIGAWSSGTAYPETTFSEGCAIISGYIYCIGGSNGVSFISDTYGAPISSTGTGSWGTDSAYGGGAESQIECVSSGSNVYCVGGYNGAISQSVYYATPSATNIGGWTSTTSYPQPITNGACVAYNGYIYCVNGYNSYQQTYYAPLSSTGVGTWTYSGNYPVADAYFNCGVYGGDIYCVGGSVGTLTYYAPLSTTGIGTWTAGTAYPVSAQEVTCATGHGYLYCVGSVSQITTSYYAPVSTTGIGTWITGTPYPIGIDYSSCATD